MLDLDAELEEYIGLHSEPEPEILQQLSRATHQKILRPRMLSGNLQGQFLKMLCRMNRVQRVLEIGTFTGYAAISMAMGMGEKGVLHTIDINDEIEDFTRNYIERSGLAGQIVFHIGDACEIIPGLDECFDLVFIDADKRQYTAYYRLWDGKVTEKDTHDAQTRGILEFNELVQADTRVENLLLPVRHGLMLIRKKD